MKLNDFQHVTKNNVVKRNPRHQHSNSVGWRKEIIDRVAGIRYEWIKGEYTVDVSLGNEQGYAGSNMVTVRTPRGFILDSPKTFSSIEQAHTFVRFAKEKINKGQVGRTVFYTE